LFIVIISYASYAGSMCEVVDTLVFQKCMRTAYVCLVGISEMYEDSVRVLYIYIPPSNTFDTPLNPLCPRCGH